MSKNRNVLELNTMMMLNTFKIVGGKSLGTCFLMGRPLTNDPNCARFVLVTAAHVLEQMNDSVAMLHLRIRQNDSYIRHPVQIRIRQGNNPLWTKNSSGLDVAVMYIGLPNGVDNQPLFTKFLADDSVLTRFEIHPGDELSCLGFPLGFESNQSAGFPVLRSGKIASFPLVPTQMYPTFLLDFQVYAGNSGGPVYFVESGRNFAGAVHLGGKIQYIFGLVTKEMSLTSNIADIYSQEQRHHPLYLAEIVQASHILNTINQLPESE